MGWFWPRILLLVAAALPCFVAERDPGAFLTKLIQTHRENKEKTQKGDRRKAEDRDFREFAEALHRSEEEGTPNGHFWKEKLVDVLEEFKRDPQEGEKKWRIWEENWGLEPTIDEGNDGGEAEGRLRVPPRETEKVRAKEHLMKALNNNIQLYVKNDNVRIKEAASAMLQDLTTELVERPIGRGRRNDTAAKAVGNDEKVRHLVRRRVSGRRFSKLRRRRLDFGGHGHSPHGHSPVRPLLSAAFWYSIVHI